MAEFGVRTVVVAATMTLVLPFEGLAQQQWNVGQTINITGRVVTDDGAPPPQPASVALSCGGSAGARLENVGIILDLRLREAERVNSLTGRFRLRHRRLHRTAGQRMRGCEVHVTLLLRAAPDQLTGAGFRTIPECLGLLFRVRREDWLRRIHSALSSSPKESRMAFEKGVSQNRSRQYRRPGSAWQKRWRSTRNTPKPGTN